MTSQEIDEIFPPTYGGNAQISDLRLMLSKLVTNEYMSRITYTEVPDLISRDNLIPKESDICKVIDAGGTNPEVYIWDINTKSWTNIGTTPSQQAGAAARPLSEEFIANSSIVQSQQVIIQHIPRANEHLFIFLNGLYLSIGATADYTIIGNKITFVGNPIQLNDRIVIKYSY
jgi:hypothetical protein